MSTVILEEALATAKLQLGTCNSFNTIRKKVDTMEEQLSDIRAISELQERMQTVEDNIKELQMLMDRLSMQVQHLEPTKK